VRTFLVVWATQSVSVVGSALTFFATTIWLSSQLYPLAEQKPELSRALAAMSVAAGRGPCLARSAGGTADGGGGPLGLSIGPQSLARYLAVQISLEV
jgi:MFS transporter, DHA3 family, macrolide efflux protein